VFDAVFELEGGVVPVGPDAVPDVDVPNGEEPPELEPEPEVLDPEEPEVEGEFEGLLLGTELWPPALPLLLLPLPSPLMVEPDVSEEPDWEPEVPELD
jgi:hypothetical protein